ncbi:GWxTD domain-containing protein [candidate division KSB1 bacterium]|nr:GWxTD domain-containing protein [candidate division KSB1 bacterium]MBL7094296.1 GWxTD domain-containing protein [candidate division KSB1 bacterium]
MKKNILICCLSVFLSLLISTILFSQQKLSLNMDICQYRFNPDSSLIEIYYSLLPAKENSPESSAFVLELRITENQKPVINNLWKVQAEKQGEEEEQTQMIVDALRYLLTPGSYDLKLIAKNILQPNDIDSVEISNLKIKSFGTENVQMSDVEISQKIIPVNPANKNKFDKNRFNVTPFPLKVFAKENSDVYYYFESYNLKPILKQSIFNIKRVVFDVNGLPVPTIPAYSKKKRLRGMDDVEVGMFKISELPTGKYYLNFAILDSNLSEISSTTTSFYVHNPDVQVVDRNSLPIEAQMSGSEIALLPQENLEIMIKATKYLVNDEEAKIINKLVNENANRIYLYRFWKERDSNPNTLALESYREMLKRVQFSNANFASMQKAGWESDRGRVLIKFGQPSEIQYYPNVAEFKEFQAWGYDNIESGVVFIFGVLGAFGNLQLIHSTKTGELRNDFWFDLLKVSAGQTGMQQMEQGISNRSTLREIFQRNNLELPRYLK